MKKENVSVGRWVERARHDSSARSSNQAVSGSPRSHLGDSQEGGLVHSMRGLLFPSLFFPPLPSRRLCGPCLPPQAQLSDRQTTVEVSFPH